MWEGERSGEEGGSRRRKRIARGKRRWSKRE